MQPADTELLKLYAEIEKDESVKKLLDSSGTVHASLAMALSSVGGGRRGGDYNDEDDEELTMEELMAKTGARPATSLKRAFVGPTDVPSQLEVSFHFSFRQLVRPVDSAPAPPWPLALKNASTWT